MWSPSFLQPRTGPSASNRSKRGRRQSAHSRRTSAPLQVEPLEQRWCPSYSLVTSRSALAGTDSVNWGTLGPAGTLVANPFTILSTSGRSVSVSQPTQFGGFGVLEQTPPSTVSSWNGNFAPGDMLLKGGNFGTKKSDPTTLNFGTTAVAAGGAQIEADYNGKFTAEVQALDASGNILASFTEDGNATHAADNSAIFIGISSTSANIYQIALSLTHANEGTIGDFAINKFDFRTSALTPMTPAVARIVAQGTPAVLASVNVDSLSIGDGSANTVKKFDALPPPAERTAVDHLFATQISRPRLRPQGLDWWSDQDHGEDFLGDGAFPGLPEA